MKSPWPADGTAARTRAAGRIIRAPRKGAAARLDGAPARNRPEAMRSPRLLQCDRLPLRDRRMDAETKAALARIAEALERLAPPKARAVGFAAARLFRHEPTTGDFIAAPDFPLALDMLVGVERQKLRFLENLGRFAAGLPANHALLWGVRGTGKSSLAKAAFMDVAAEHAELKLVEIDRDEVESLPALFDELRGRSERF